MRAAGFIGSLLLLFAVLVDGRTTAADQPNVLIILTDDQGWGDLSLHGNQNLATPNIDSVAAQGAQFDRFYVCPVCSPTRAEFLTGRYHPRSGVYSTSAGGERMDLDEITVADTFRAAGYATAAFGKWHNGMQYPYHPNGRGFDEFYGFCSGHWGDYFDAPMERNGRLVQGEGFCIDDFTTQAIEFMQRCHQQDRPFFAYLPYNTPHSPMQVPDRFWSKFEGAELGMRHRDEQKEDLGHTRAALAMCENIDWNVGRLLEKLDEWQIANNTIVLYFCDNGPNGSRWNGGMKGRKGSTDEGGVRSPMLVRWPARIDGGKRIPQIAGAVDLLPTLADLTEIPLLSEQPLDGMSVAPLLTDDPPGDWPDREIISHWNNKISVRNQRFRLDHQGQLFEIPEDPGQYTDVSADYPEIHQRLSSIASAFRAEIAGYRDERPFLIGHEAYRYTQMPARDAVGSGGITRSNRFPNCSFLTNWTSTEETIEWDAVVAASGTYRVELQYTCPQKDIGSTIELRCGESRLRAKVTVPHDPPLRGDEHDRVPRMESYVKDFHTLELGTIFLQQGDGPLVLAATDIPASQVLDFRLLMFTRVEDAAGER